MITRLKLISPFEFYSQIKRYNYIVVVLFVVFLVFLRCYDYLITTLVLLRV